MDPISTSTIEHPPGLYVDSEGDTWAHRADGRWYYLSSGHGDAKTAAATASPLTEYGPMVRIDAPPADDRDPLVQAVASAGLLAADLAAIEHVSAIITISTDNVPRARFEVTP